MSNSTRSLIIKEIAEKLNVPASAYEAAAQRYEDLGNWLQDSSKSISASFNPNIKPQGSFRLGTVTRPWKRDDFDLDLTCILQEGFSKNTHTQKELKELVGQDLEKYRNERKIQEKLEEKHRCWRLNYQDQPKFHMDGVPAIPEDVTTRIVLQERMIEAGVTEPLAHTVAELAIAITDNQEPNYPIISPRWNISNPEGYAKWFEFRMQQAKELLESRVVEAMVAKLDQLPVYRWKTPLQICIQILKRHRDIMFENDPDGKPISIIITTLAARAYQGESDLEAAFERIVTTMGDFVQLTAPRVANPVNTAEDFADKWPRDSRLEANFRKWLTQVQKDFSFWGKSDDLAVIAKDVSERFGVHIDQAKLKRQHGLLSKVAAIIAGAAHTGPNGIIGSTGIINKGHEFYG